MNGERYDPVPSASPARQERFAGRLSDLSRRDFMASFAATAVFRPGRSEASGKRDFKISLAGWSFHREVREGRHSQLELFQLTRDEFDIRAFELVNSMLEVPTLSYVGRLAQAADKAGVAIPLIMIDGEGNLGSQSPDEQRRALRYHSKWIEVASDLGCQWIRVNWGGYQENVLQEQALADAFISRSRPVFQELVEMAQRKNLTVLIENHGGGPSTRPSMLAKLIQGVGPGLGTLPDFGNFPAGTDRYQAVDAMMPYAGAVSAKCYDFDTDGRETSIDFENMLAIVVDRHGYHGNIGIEYEGDRLSEIEGISKCLSLLRKLRDGAQSAGRAT